MIHVIQIKIKKLYLSIVFLFPKHGTVLTPIIFAPDSPSCGLNMWLISVVQATFPHLCPATVHQPATPGRHPSRRFWIIVFSQRSNRTQVRLHSLSVLCNSCSSLPWPWSADKQIIKTGYSCFRVQRFSFPYLRVRSPLVRAATIPRVISSRVVTALTWHHPLRIKISWAPNRSVIRSTFALPARDYHHPPVALAFR